MRLNMLQSLINGAKKLHKIDGVITDTWKLKGCEKIISAALRFYGKTPTDTLVTLEGIKFNVVIESNIPGTVLHVDIYDAEDELLYGWHLLK